MAVFKWANCPTNFLTVEEVASIFAHQKSADILSEVSSCESADDSWVCCSCSIYIQLSRLNLQSSLNLLLSKRIIRASSSQSPPFTFSDSTSYGQGTYRTWDKTSTKYAVEAVEKGESVRKAAELYNVPRSTLHDRVSGKTAKDARYGPQLYLTLEEEEELTRVLLQAAKIGYPHTRKQIIALVQQVVHNKGMMTTVTNDCWERFLKRHAQLTLRVAVPLSYARAMASDP